MAANDVQQCRSGPESSVVRSSLLGPADSPMPAPTELDEVVYPYEDDIAMAYGPLHEQATVDTRHALENYCASRPNAYLGMNMLVYYERYDITKRVTPDLYIVFDARRPIGRNYRIWDAGKPPDVVWELAPYSDMKGDPEEKKELYRQLGVPEYWWYDSSGELDGPRLQGFQLVNGQYRKLPAIRRGRNSRWVKSPLLGLEHRFNGQRLRLWDPSAREYLRTGRESEEGRLKEIALRETALKRWQRAREQRFRALKRLQRARARTQREARRAAAARACNEELRAKLAKLEASVSIPRKQG